MESKHYITKRPEKPLYDIANQNIKNDYCPHIFDHFLNTFLNSKCQKLNLSTEQNIEKKELYFRNLSIFQNPLKTFNCYGYQQSKNLLDSFLIKNFNLDWIILNNPQNLPFSSINREGCIFTFNYNSIGTILAASNHNHSIEIWDIKNKKLKTTITEHKEIVTGVEFFHGNLENNMILSCSLDKTIKLWKNYKNIHTFVEHNDWVRCMSIRDDNAQFLSGCVSSVVKLWDMATQSVIGNIINQNPDPSALSTVNSLGFMKKNPNLFVVGLRSGEVKIFDSRIKGRNSMTNDKISNVGLVQCFKAHSKKLNTAKLNDSTNNYLLTSSRDSLLRLWDVRKLPDANDDEKSIKANKKYINEYNKHKCSGYNIECNFFLKEKYIITGSENNNIYIYSTLNPEIYYKIPTQQKCVNLIKPIPHSYSFAFTGLEDISIFIWSPRKNITKCYDFRYNEKIHKEDDFSYFDDFDEEDLSNYDEKDESQQLCSKLIEEIMAECGDMILKIFHSHNLTYSNGINFESLIDIIQKSNDEKSMKIIQMINQKFIGRFMQDLGNNNKKAEEKKEEKKNTKAIDIKYNKIKCLECDLESVDNGNNIFNCVDRDLLNELLELPNEYEFNQNKENLAQGENNCNSICSNKELEDKKININGQMRGLLFI